MSTIKVNNIVPPNVGEGVSIDGLQMPTAGALSNRNLIINGAMTVAQRGTSETGVTSTKYANACDRFKVNGNNGTWTISQDTDAPDGFSNSFKMLLTATEAIGSTSYWLAEQKIEGQNLQHLAYGTSAAKTVTVSFWVKSNVTGTYCLNLYQDDGSKNFPKTYTIDTANTWEYKTISYVGDTATALDNDNATSLRLNFFVVAGSSYSSGSTGSRVAYTAATFGAGQSAQVDAVNDYWQITGVQLEAGTKATPFEHRSYGDELQRCQRYYRQNGRLLGIWSSAQNMRFIQTLAPEMRTSPTVVLLDSNGYHEYWTQIGYNGISSILGTSGHAQAQDFTVASSQNRGRTLNQPAMLERNVVSFNSEL